MKAEGNQEPEVIEEPGYGMSERHKSKQRWRKVQTGKYESPDGNHYARKYEGKWQLWQYDGKLGGRYESWTLDSWHLTLADCQEHAELRERLRAGYRELYGKADDASV